MSYVIEPPAAVSLAVAGTSDRFPVGQIFCVGRNYADHAVEMGHDPDREPPFFFIKPAFTILEHGHEMTYPAFSDDVHHEVEMVVAIGKGGSNISTAQAGDHIYGYATGIDMTRRDLQAEAKSLSRPWEAGKTFKHASPCSAVTPKTQSGEINAADISLSVNGQVRQQGNVNQMIWKVNEVISRLSELFVLQAGDLIYTGTPAGVGPIEPGDAISAAIAGVGQLDIRVAA